MVQRSAQMNLKKCAERVNDHIKKYYYLYGILLIVGLGEVLINPIGEFPLNDDWAYTKIVKNYILENKIKSPDTGGSIFLFQLYIAVLVSKIFGFSFTLLRCIGVVFGILGVVVMYHIFMQIQDSKKLATIGTLLFCMNPIYLNGANSFHPDVPTIFFMLLSFYCFIRYFYNRTFNFYVLGILFAILACAIKQTSLSIGIAFAICGFISCNINIRNLINAIIPLCLTGLLIYIYYYSVIYFYVDWPGAYQSHGIKSVFFDKIFNHDYVIIERMGYHLLTTSLSLGIFASPLTLPFVIKRFFKKKIKPYTVALLLICFFVIVLIIALKIYFRHNQGVVSGGIWYMPFVGPNIYDFGIGPIYATGIHHNDVPGVFQAGKYFWFSVSIIGAISFISFLYIITICFKKSYSGTVDIINIKRLILIFSLLIMMFSFLPYLFLYPHAKYLTLYFPFMIIAIISAFDIMREKIIYTYKFPLKIIIIFSIPIFIFGVLGTRDYLTFHRARWGALKFLTDNKKIPVQKIDGGFEFNEWHLSHLYIWKMTDDPRKKGRFWPVVDDEYIVTVTEIEGYDVYKEFKYRRWLPPGNHSINVLKRNTGQKNL